MAHAENEITVDRPSSEVYDFLADGLNNTKWRSGVQAIALNSGQAGAVGAVYSQTLTGPGGRPIAGDYRITTAEAGKQLCFEVVAGPARPVGTYTLREVPGGTVLRFILDLQPKGLLKLLTPVITRTMQAEVRQLQNLKTILETPGGAPPAQLT